MSKRVSNKKGGGGARSGRVRLGFHRKRRISNVERAMAEHRKKTVLGKPMDDETKIYLDDLGKALSSLVPKRMRRRGVR